jgi:hypothetical protein
MKSVILSLALAMLFAPLATRSAGADDYQMAPPPPPPSANFAPDRLAPGAAVRMAPQSPFVRETPLGIQNGTGLGEERRRRPASGEY